MGHPDRLLFCVFPGFGVFPTDVDGVVEVEEEAFASVEEAEAEDIVIDEGGCGVEDDVPDEGDGGAADFAFGGDELADLGAVAVHVLEVEVQGGVSVVEHVSTEGAALAFELRSAVRADAFAEPGRAATEETQLVVGVEATVAHPAAKDEIAAGDPIGAVGGGVAEGEDLPDAFG